MIAIAVLVVALSPHSMLVEKPNHEMCGPAPTVIEDQIKPTVAFVAPPAVVPPAPVFYTVPQANARTFRLFSPVLRQGRSIGGLPCTNGSCR